MPERKTARAFGKGEIRRRTSRTRVPPGSKARGLLAATRTSPRSPPPLSLGSQGVRYPPTGFRVSASSRMKHPAKTRFRGDSAPRSASSGRLYPHASAPRATDRHAEERVLHGSAVARTPTSRKGSPPSVSTQAAHAPASERVAAGLDRAATRKGTRRKRGTDPSHGTTQLTRPAVRGDGPNAEEGDLKAYGDRTDDRRSRLQTNATRKASPPRPHAGTHE